MVGVLVFIDEYETKACPKTVQDLRIALQQLYRLDQKIIKVESIPGTQTFLVRWIDISNQTREGVQGVLGTDRGGD